MATPAAPPPGMTVEPAQAFPQCGQPDGTAHISVEHAQPGPSFQMQMIERQNQLQMPASFAKQTVAEVPVAPTGSYPNNTPHARRAQSPFDEDGAGLVTPNRRPQPVWSPGVGPGQG